MYARENMLSVFYLLVLSGAVLLGGGGVEASHHRRHHHPQQIQQDEPPPLRLKFPHLDRVLGRYEAEKMARVAPKPPPTAAPATTTTMEPSPHKELWKARQAIMFSTFDDDYEDDYYTDNQQMDQNPSQNLTAVKWNTLGTADAVARTMRNTEEAKQAAYSLLNEIASGNSCKVPQVRCLKASNLLPGHSRRYAPNCVKLHRCAEDSGCCSHPEYECGPKRIVQALAILYVTELNTRQSVAQQFYFDNHTECHCVLVPSRIIPTPAPLQDSRTRAGRTAYFGDQTDLYHRHPSSHRPVPAPQRNGKENCICPTKFTVRNLVNGSCVCDCFDRERECLRFKKGRESFSREDTECISESRCRTPICEFGTYRDFEGRGRCPMKDERFYSSFKPPVAQALHSAAPPALPPVISAPSWPLRSQPGHTFDIPGRLERPPSWIYTADKKWPPQQGIFVFPTPSAPPAWSRPTTPSTTTPRPTPRWNPQPISPTPSPFPWMARHAWPPKPPEEKKMYQAPSKWSLTSPEFGGGFAWNPEETMRHKHNKKA
ncbi:uncharacterized protein LOC132196540 [Neocloeon triangulifer]|uniref:uncharacterized protein LOC132196540 n=1 Tax=Neocloeon triangulifer TaxID=2078957 RepID=UPI00286F2829|nr:uncharacterized protein LOC132196540 [Neocloeon triangulifer]